MTVIEEMVQIFKIHILCVVICITVNYFITILSFLSTVLYGISLLCCEFWSFSYKINEDDFQYLNRAKLLTRCLELCI